MNDKYDLERFVSAQRGRYNTALAEIRRGRKESHWIWYIFPQIAGLGMSSTSRHYAISGLDEAAAYLAHPVLGERLEEISRALLEVPTDNASQVFGWPDDMKLRSSMTLFSLVKPGNPVFSAVLDKFFGGQKDESTLQILGLD